MNPTYTLIESPDDGGWYAEFWDRQTGRNIIDDNGNILHSEVLSESYQADRLARRIRAETDWDQYHLQEGPDTVNRMMFMSGEKRREYWTFCSRECALEFWNESQLEDTEWLGKQDIANLFPYSPGHIVMTCNTCHKEISTRGYTPGKDARPTDILWWWER